MSEGQKSQSEGFLDSQSHTNLSSKTNNDTTKYP